MTPASKGFRPGAELGAEAFGDGSRIGGSMPGLDQSADREIPRFAPADRQRDQMALRPAPDLREGARPFVEKRPRRFAAVDESGMTFG
jgi:hypothetical protein